MSFMHKVVEMAKKSNCKGTVVDVDKTTHYDRFAESIGYGFLKRELKRLNLGNFLSGLKGALEIRSDYMKNNDEEKDARCLEKLFHVLGKTGNADRNYAYAVASKHGEEKELPGVKGFIQELKTIGPVFISTSGCDIAADIVMNKYGLDGWSSNPLTYRNGNNEIISEPIAFLKDGKLEGYAQFGNCNPIINGCKTVIRNSKDKKEYTEKLLDKFGLELSEVLSIGNDDNDSLILENSRISASSPLADEKTIKKTHYQIRSYLD
jgi:phosphoserine phosphatase